MYDRNRCGSYIDTTGVLNEQREGQVYGKGFHICKDSPATSKIYLPNCVEPFVDTTIADFNRTECQWGCDPCAKNVYTKCKQCSDGFWLKADGTCEVGLVTWYGYQKESVFDRTSRWTMTHVFLKGSFFCSYVKRIRGLGHNHNLRSSAPGPHITCSCLVSVDKNCVVVDWSTTADTLHCIVLT